MSIRVMAIFILVGIGMVSVALASERAVTLSVETMICGPDPHIIKASVLALKGVKAVAISLENRSVLVTYDDHFATVDGMLVATAKAGYAAVPKY